MCLEIESTQLFMLLCAPIEIKNRTESWKMEIELYVMQPTFTDITNQMAYHFFYTWYGPQKPYMRPARTKQHVYGVKYNIFAGLIICSVFFCCYSWNQTSSYSKWIDFFVRYLEMLSKMPWQPTEKWNTNKRWKENNQPHNGQNKIDTGLICSMKCPLKHAKWIWMNFELIRSVTVLGKRQLFIARNAETKYVSKKKGSENITRKGRRKLTKIWILWKKLTVIGTVWQRFDSVFFV